MIIYLNVVLFVSSRTSDFQRRIWMGRKAYLVHGSLRSLPDELSSSMIDLDHCDSQVRELDISRPLPLPRMGRGELEQGRRGNNEV